ncbi:MULTISPECIES: PglL family O-oligosaccharyltransferase [Ramlibacter]|uniref:Polymerase n=1 Tax=Ramlibacter pinisoli TaxID=2682844 RepID=A0A6N8J3R7_9BURK|nr:MULTISPECIES: O-antigen ligase family protein [Ramlibacter]MBA2962913.1 O-antigen ligase C-terminal domain-containing protein [Ramlibacter sp. CGMCC 1.13660]MVQ32856.1 polymerase [Ramlibacter pinisoli]
MAAEFSARLHASSSVAALACTTLLALPWLWPYTPGPSPNVVPLLVAWTCGLLAALAIATAARPADLLETTASRAWLAAALVSAVIGVLQWFDLAPRTPLVSLAQIGEAYGNLRQKNQFASLTAIGLAVLVFRRVPLAPAPALAAVLLLAIGNALSASRTGLVEWMALTVLAAAWPGPRKGRVALCVAGLAGYILAGALLPLLLAWWRGADALNVFVRVSTELGCSSRKVLWSNVAELIAAKPWTGWGWGELDYAHYATLYDGERFCNILDNAHNLPLHLAVEFGLPAAVLATALLAVAVLRAKPWRDADPARQLAWAVLAVVGLHSLVEYPLWYGPFQWAVLLAVALLVRVPALSPPRRGATAAGVALALVALALMAREYDTVSQAYLQPAERRPTMRADPVRAAGTPLLFRSQLEFAELSVTPVTDRSARHVHDLALRMLHYSPEPGVIEKLAESALLLGRSDEVAWLVPRYQAAFPDDYAKWQLRELALSTLDKASPERPDGLAR